MAAVGGAVMPTLSERLDSTFKEIAQAERDGLYAKATSLRAQINDLLAMIAELGLTGMAPSWEPPGGDQ